MDASEDVIVIEEIKRYDEVGEVLEEREPQITVEKVSTSFDLTSMSEEERKFFETKYDVWGAPLHDFRDGVDDDNMPALEELDKKEKEDANKK